MHENTMLKLCSSTKNVGISKQHNSRIAGTVRNVPYLIRSLRERALRCFLLLCFPQALGVTEIMTPVGASISDLHPKPLPSLLGKIFATYGENQKCTCWPSSVCPISGHTAHGKFAGGLGLAVVATCGNDFVLLKWGVRQNAVHLLLSAHLKYGQTEPSGTSMQRHVSFT